MDDGTYFYRFYSQCRDHHPYDPHIHVVRKDKTIATYKLSPVVLVDTDGIPNHKLSDIEIPVSGNESSFCRDGISILDKHRPGLAKMEITEDTIRVWLQDSRTFTVPLAW